MAPTERRRKILIQPIITLKRIKRISKVAKKIKEFLYKYFLSNHYLLDDEDFIDRVIKCMDVYKAPYKAVLIELFQEAVTKYKNIDLKEKILQHFDNKPEDLVQKFTDLGLDSELVKLSYVLNLGGKNSLIISGYI